ncbi:hypothetical protein AAH678_14720 [Sodalis endosymbiont of Spalangia cameroni]|uniref:hypothetical protein n=1 Tax=Sodalis praecaptivus TaxID=1239307 RepID=UPI0031F72843
MQLQNRELALPALAAPEIRPAECDTATLRRHVISGDWTPINNGKCTLTDLGLRHNGNGLVWLHSGVSVHEADSDTGLTGSDKVSHEYHRGLRTDNGLNSKDYFGFVHLHKIDDYCLNILTNSSARAIFEQRKDGKALSTFALQFSVKERKKAADGWALYRNPTQPDKYTVFDTKRYSGLASVYERKGWNREPVNYFSHIIRDNAEFSKLMRRLGYIQVRSRKITGLLETFWLYRSTRHELAKDTPLRTDKGLSKKAFIPFVQASERERFGFKRIPIDGKWLHVYADHIRFLTKKRIRIDGRQLTGYTAKGIPVQMLG